MVAYAGGADRPTRGRPDHSHAFGCALSRPECLLAASTMPTRSVALPSQSRNRRLPAARDAESCHRATAAHTTRTAGAGDPRSGRVTVRVLGVKPHPDPSGSAGPNSGPNPTAHLEGVGGFYFHDFHTSPYHQ